MATEIVKKFKKWKEKQNKKTKTKEYKHKTKEGIAKYIREAINNPEEFGKNWAEEEKLEELFKLIDQIGNTETKVRLYIEDFEKQIAKKLEVKTYLKLQSLKKIVSGIQQDLLEQIQGG